MRVHTHTHTHTHTYQTPVVRHGEKVRVIIRDAHARDGARVALVLLIFVRQWKLPRLDRAVLGAREEHAARVREDHLVVVRG